jgi:energy-coupling factor transporter transmembrane protein EcfT
MKPFLPKRLEPVAYGLLLSGLMSFIVSGLSTAIASGVDAGLPMRWLAAWVPSWGVAFPAVLVVAPMVRGALRRIVVKD